MDHAGEAAQTRRLGVQRVAVGLAQGAALFGLSEAREGRLLDPVSFGALAMVAMFAPVVLLGSLGALRARTLLIWTAVSTVALAFVGAYAAAMRWETPPIVANWPEPPVVMLAPLALFIAHHLILAADAERRWIADYRRYFELASTNLVRIGLSAAFVGALWLLLFMGTALFGLINLTFFRDLIQEPIFALPATATFFAWAIHMTDVRAALARSVRAMALTLLSWLAPVLALIALAFLSALPFTGLAPLWATNRAAAILLSAAAALILLLNAAYQDGEPADTPPRVLKWTGRIAALLLIPLTGLAGFAVALRIGQHGLTPERIVAAAFVAIGAVFAIGYALAALRPGPWLKGLERTNVVTAHVSLAILVVLVTPIADPNRLAVDDQLARLTSGRIAPEKFDYGFLRFDAGRYGHDALQRIAAGKAGPAEIARRAAAALAASDRGDLSDQSPAERAASIEARERPLPAAFAAQAWASGENPYARCEGATPKCVAWRRDLDGQPGDEVLVVGGGAAQVYRLDGAAWKLAGTIQPSFCDGAMEALREGRFELAAPLRAWKEIAADGRRLRLVEERPTDCARAPSN